MAMLCLIGAIALLACVAADLLLAIPVPLLVFQVQVVGAFLLPVLSGLLARAAFHRDFPLYRSDSLHRVLGFVPLPLMRLVQISAASSLIVGILLASGNTQLASWVTESPRNRASGLLLVSLPWYLSSLFAVAAARRWAHAA